MAIIELTVLQIDVHGLNILGEEYLMFFPTFLEGAHNNCKSFQGGLLVLLLCLPEFYRDRVSNSSSERAFLRILIQTKMCVPSKIDHFENVLLNNVS